MKRPTLFLPLFGLLLFFAAWAARGLRGPGLSLAPLPPAVDVQLEPISVPMPGAHLRGDVRDAEGRPVAEALVKLIADDEPIWTYTDTRGRFALAGVPAGSHAVLIWTRRHHLNQLELEAPADGLVLTLEHDFGELEELPALERAPLRGTLVAALEGQVLAGYELALRPVAPPETFGAPIERRVLVDSDHSFVFEDLLLGEYQLGVHPPWARGGRWPDLVDSTSYAHTRAGGSRPLEVSLSSGEIEGWLRDERGSAVAGALLLIHLAGAAERPWPPVTSDAAGAFVLRDLPPGEYELEVRAGEAREQLRVRSEAGQRRAIEVPTLATRASEPP